MFNYLFTHVNLLRTVHYSQHNSLHIGKKYFKYTIRFELISYGSGFKRYMRFILLRKHYGILKYLQLIRDRYYPKHITKKFYDSKIIAFNTHILKKQTPPTVT